MVRAALASILIATSSLSGMDLPDDTVIYGVLPTLFNSDEPLNGVTGQLDALRDLGVTVLWLSPLTVSDDPSHISYAVTDYRRLRADFGTPRDLKTLVKEAHARGMKVILDFVPNHTSSKHPWFLDAQKKGKESMFANYYQQDSQGNPVHYFDWENLPNLNFDNPRVREEITSAMKFWIEEYGVDGFRMDAVWGVRERKAQALRSLCAEVLAAHPNTILIAEAGAGDPFYFEQGFQVAYDWTDRLGEWAWEEEFAKPVPDGRKLAALAMEGADPQKTLRFLNNNDTGDRFVTKHGLERTRAAAVFQLTVPGIPLVYSGDEIAAEFDPYDDSPPLSWKDPHNFRAFYKHLIVLRKSIPALSAGKMELVEAVDAPSVSAYLRRVDESSWALVVVNFGEDKEVVFLIPESVKIPGSAVWDTLNGCSVPVGEGRSISLFLHENSAAILMPAR